MKICPKCGKTYPNDSTAFCFNDGVPLKAAPQESSPAEAEPAAEAAPEAAVPKDAGVPAAGLPGAGLPGAGLPAAGASKRPRGGLFSAPSPLQALDAPLPAVSSHTLLPDDFEAEAPAAVQLGPHQLGSSILATPQLLLFALADGRAAWVHPPDRPGRERFVKRVELARRGGDPSLLRVQDQGEHQGVAYAVVARPAGHDLASLMAGLRAKGIERLEAPYVWELGRALAGALAGLHRVQDGGVVGDLAPGRVFVDPEGRIQLLALVGPTPALPLNDELDRWARLAPEQCMRPESVDARADLFALGCLLWTLLTGRQHHLKSDRISTIKALAEGPPVDLASPLHALLARCMDPDPERRPQSAAALLDALKQIGQADKAHWGALIAQAFPAGAPALSGAELERVNGVLDILRGVAPLPQVAEHAPEMPDWPAPKAAPEPAVEPEPTPEPAAEPETPEPEAAEPEAAEPEAASLTSSAPDVAEVEEPPESEDGGDDDSLAGGFFSDPAPSEPPPVAETPEPPITPQRSWGLPIAGALLGVLLLGAAGYLTWSSMQEEGGAPAGVPSAVQDAPKPPKVEPPPAPPVDEDQVQEEEEQPPSEPETTPPQDAQPTNTPAAPSTDEATSAQTLRAQDSRASTTRSSGGSSRRGSTSETPAEPATTPNSGAALNTAGGTATDGRSIGSGARRGGGRAEEPKEDEGWEASPWGASQEQPASEQPASGGEDDNPWGEVE